jgi:hypothetical protein
LEVGGVQMEFLRLTGRSVGKIDWSGITASPAELRAYAKDALAGFYEADAHSYWPKPQWAPNAAEEVGIVADDGTELARYSIKDMIDETKKSLIGNRHARRP